MHRAGTVTYVLTGPMKGRTARLGKYSFVKGQCDVRGSAEHHKLISNFLYKNWQAVPEDELRQHEEQANARNISAGTDRQADRPTVQDRGHEEPAQAGASAFLVQPAVQSERTAPAPQQEGAGGDGPSEQVDDAKHERIRAALGALDHDDVTHWTAEGRPRVALVNDLLDGERVTAAEIEAAMPGFRRDKKEQAQ